MPCAALDWWQWRTGPENRARDPFFELTLYSIADKSCSPAAEEETESSCPILLDFEPDELRGFVTERVPFYRSGTHREMLEGFLDPNVGCLQWDHRWTVKGRLYTISKGEQMRQGPDGTWICPKKIR